MADCLAAALANYRLGTAARLLAIAPHAPLRVSGISSLPQSAASIGQSVSGPPPLPLVVAFWHHSRQEVVPHPR